MHPKGSRAENMQAAADTSTSQDTDDRSKWLPNGGGFNKQQIAILRNQPNSCNVIVQSLGLRWELLAHLKWKDANDFVRKWAQG